MYYYRDIKPFYKNKNRWVVYQDVVVQEVSLKVKTSYLQRE